MSLTFGQLIFLLFLGLLLFGNLPNVLRNLIQTCKSLGALWKRSPSEKFSRKRTLSKKLSSKRKGVISRKH